MIRSLIKDKCTSLRRGFLLRRMSNIRKRRQVELVEKADMSERLESYQNYWFRVTVPGEDDSQLRSQLEKDCIEVFVTPILISLQLNGPIVARAVEGAGSLEQVKGLKEIYGAKNVMCEVDYIPDLSELTLSDN